MQWLSHFWQSIRRYFFKKRTRLKICRVHELPEVLSPLILYAVGENEHLWFAAMVCPCNCKSVLYMNLSPSERPQWFLSEHRNGTVTLHPSVWRKVGCKSHFWLRKGQIYWCK